MYFLDHENISRWIKTLFELLTWLRDKVSSYILQREIDLFQIITCLLIYKHIWICVNTFSKITLFYYLFIHLFLKRNQVLRNALKQLLTIINKLLKSFESPPGLSHDSEAHQVKYSILWPCWTRHCECPCRRLCTSWPTDKRPSFTEIIWWHFREP